MANPQMPGQEPVKTDPKEELKKQRINLHNLKFQGQMIEAIIKRLEVLSR